MTIKGILGTLILTFFLGSFANAQDSTATNTDECKKFRSLYYQYLKQKMYNDAADFWSKAVDACGEDKLDAKFWKNGRYIYTKILGEGVDSVREANINDTIKWIYIKRMAVEDDLIWTGDYAASLVTLKSKDFDEIDSLFKRSIHTLKSKAKPTHIKKYFSHLIINKFNSAPAEEKENARAEVIDEYIILSEYIAIALKEAEEKGNEKQIKRLNSAQNFLDKYFLKIAKDCDALAGVFEKKFETLPEDKAERIEKVNKYLGLMDQKKCQSSDVYGKFVYELIELEPTAEANYFGGSYAKTNGNNKKAKEYFAKAVELEGDGENKDKYLLSYASSQYKAKSYKAAFRTAKNVGAGDYKADALMICANSIAATANSCGSSTFERNANYWLANDYIRKAIAAGKKGVSSSKFLNNAPDANAVFTEGKTKGASFSLSCWGESTIIRF